MENDQKTFGMQPTLPASGRNAPRVGNLGHVTRIANKITQLGNVDSRIQTHIQVCNYYESRKQLILNA